MGNLLCMGLILWFRYEPSPRALDVADDGLAAFMNVDVFNRDFLLALAAVAVQRFEKCGVGAGEWCRRGVGRN